MILDHVAGVPPRDANPPTVFESRLHTCECGAVDRAALGELMPDGWRNRAGAATCPRCDERTD